MKDILATAIETAATCAAIIVIAALLSGVVLAVYVLCHQVWLF